MNKQVFQITVIGGGSSGIITVSELLAFSFNKIAWVDPAFDCGTLKDYESIPSNTKVSFQLRVANQSSWIQQCKRNQEVADTFNGLDPENTSPLGFSYQMFQKMTAIINETAKGKVHFFRNESNNYVQQQDNTWEVILKDGSKIYSKEVIFCTGGKNRNLVQLIPKPFEQNPHIQYMDLLYAMCKNRAPNYFSKDDVVAIFGASHSGFLALMVLYSLEPAKRPKKIYLFYLGEVYFAEYVQNGKIKYDFVGLKGDVAKFTADIFQRRPNDIEFVQSSEEQMSKIFPTVTKVVSAVGFQRNQLGSVYLKDGTKIADDNIKYDPCMAYLVDKVTDKPIDGLYGGGIAFPEKKVDLCGSPDCAVGFFKQMNYVKKLLNVGIIRPRL